MPVPSAVKTQKHDGVPAEAKGRKTCTDSSRTVRAVPSSLPLSSLPPEQNMTLPPWKMVLKSYLLLSPHKSPLVLKCHVILKENQPNLWNSKASKEGRKTTPTEGQSYARTRESRPRGLFSLCSALEVSTHLLMHRRHFSLLPTWNCAFLKMKT